MTAAVNGLSSVIGADSDGLKRRRGSREAPGEHFGHKHDYSQLVNETVSRKHIANTDHALSIYSCSRRHILLLIVYSY